MECKPGHRVRIMWGGVNKGKQRLVIGTVLSVGRPHGEETKITVRADTGGRVRHGTFRSLMDVWPTRADERKDRDREMANMASLGRLAGGFLAKHGIQL